MKPYPDQILRSIRYSLDTVIIPQLTDGWARYEARTMDKMLEHLELRWRHEARLLLEDSHDLQGLFAELAGQLESVTADSEAARDLAAEMRTAVEAGVGLPGRVPGVEELTERNDAYRALLVRTIETLDEIMGDDRAHAELLREEIGRYLRREIDRDNELAQPTHMSFAPPKPKKGNA